MSEFGGLRKHKKTQHALNNYCGVARLCCSWLSLGKSDPNFPWEIPIGTTKRKKKNEKEEKNNGC